MNFESLKENPRQLAIGGVAALVLLVALIMIVPRLGSEKQFDTPSGVTAFITKARQAVTDPKFADVNILPDAAGNGVMVSGNLKTDADVQEARRLIEGIQPAVPVTFNLNSVDKAPPPPK